MVKAIFDLIFEITRLILLIVFGKKFIMNCDKENKTLYYGILVLIFLISRT